MVFMLVIYALHVVLFMEAAFFVEIDMLASCWFHASIQERVIAGTSAFSVKSTPTLGKWHPQWENLIFRV